MIVNNLEIYTPRSVSDLGNWKIDPVTYKVYGILAQSKTIPKKLLNEALEFARHDVSPIISAQGEDNGLGFIIIHPGDLGVSIIVHWWIQGSVLCQQIKRTLWESDNPMDTHTRPVIACVWELGLINAEQQIWRKTMMINEPDSKAYIQTRVANSVV